MGQRKSLRKKELVCVRERVRETVQYCLSRPPLSPHLAQLRVPLLLLCKRIRPAPGQDCLERERAREKVIVRVGVCARESVRRGKSHCAQLPLSPHPAQLRVPMFLCQRVRPTSGQECLEPEKKRARARAKEKVCKKDSHCAQPPLSPHLTQILVPRLLCRWVERIRHRSDSQG